MYLDIKFLFGVKFTPRKKNPQERLNNNKFFPQIIIATASCIGNSLDFDDVYHVLHVGFPSSILDAIQEMGRCRRNREDPDQSSPQTQDQYTLLFIVSICT